MQIQYFLIFVVLHFSYSKDIKIEPKTYFYTESKVQNTTVQPQDKLIVRLIENLSTGHAWYISKQPKNLQIDKFLYERPYDKTKNPNQPVGVPIDVEYEIKCLKDCKGSLNVEFVYIYYDLEKLFFEKGFEKYYDKAGLQPWRVEISIKYKEIDPFGELMIEF